MNKNNFLSWIEVNRENLKNNWRVIKCLLKPGVQIAPVIKSNAYGHGLVETAVLFEDLGAQYLCVNSLCEAQKLRERRIKCKILLMGPVFQFELNRILELDVETFLDDMRIANLLSNLAVRKNKSVSVHLKVDTGMGRRGVLTKEAFSFLKSLLETPALKVKGVATHFASSENLSTSLFAYQLENFNSLTSKITDFYSQNRLPRPLFHCANTEAILRDKKTNFDLVRPGFGLYGYSLNNQLLNNKEHVLQPALQWKSLVAEIKEVPAGYSVGYDATYITKNRSRIAIIPIGYGSGLKANLCNCWSIVYKNKLINIIGKISMNMTTVDVTNCPEMKVMDEVLIVGSSSNSLISMAEAVNVSPYEILVSLKSEIPRIWT